jgi:hypothetical protein
MAAPAVSFVAVGALGVGTGDVEAGYPAGLAADDILILHIQGDWADTGADPQGDFGGTLIGTIWSGGLESIACRSTAYWKRATGSESGTVTITDAGTITSARISAFRGCVSEGSPIHDLQTDAQATGDNSIEFTQFEMPRPNSMGVILHAAGDDTPTASWIAGDLDSITEMYEDVSPIVNDFRSTGMYGPRVVPGVSGTVSATSGSPETYANIGFCLLPDEPVAPYYTGHNTSQATQGAISIAYPNDILADDIIILHMTTAAASEPGQGDFGGTKITSLQANAGRITVWWKRADGTESAGANLAITDQGNMTFVALTAWRNVDPDDVDPIVSPVEIADDVQNTTINFAAVTTTRANALLIDLHTASDNTVSSSYVNADLESITHLYDLRTSLYTDFSMTLAYGVKAASGLIAATAATQSTIEWEVNVSFALQPVAVAAAGGGNVAQLNGRYGISRIGMRAL